MKDPGTFGLDKTLLSMQDISQHVVNYRACSHCNGGCPRLMNMAMLHQSQVTLLCDLAKKPGVYLSQGQSPVRFTLGVYQLPVEEDTDYKRQAILAAARKVGSTVADFDDLVRSHQDSEITGDLEASETMKINIRWLLDVARNLKSRLRVIIPILEKPDWANVPA